MAEKEATVYIVDLSMNEKRHGRPQTDLEWSMTYVWDKITSIVALDRKTTLQAVIGLKSDETANNLSEDPSFAHLTVMQPLDQILLPGLNKLRSEIKPSRTKQGDAISSLVLAIDMITKKCKQLKYKRKIVLLTDGRGAMDADDVDEIAKKIVTDDIELIILGVDFDDAEYGFKEEDKGHQKAKNEAVFKNLAEECNGTFANIGAAINELGIPRVKITKPTATFRGELILANDLILNVERYGRIMVRRPATATSYTTSQTGEANQVRSARAYVVADESEPGGKKDVDEKVRGYEYGRTLVHINESDENVTKLETDPGLNILGFIQADKYDRFMSLSGSSMIVAAKGSPRDVMGLSSFIHALFELSSYAIGRYVSKENKEPLLLVLTPFIEPDFECLHAIELPFAEDVRSYTFPSLDKVVTVSGKVLKQHRNLPTNDLSDIMGEYVDAMDLSNFGHDEEGRPGEYMPMDDTFSPVLHHIDQAIRFRATHPEEPIPAPYDILTKYSKVPEELVNDTEDLLTDLMKVADVKKVPAKMKGHRRHREQIKPISGLNVDELLGAERRQRIDPANAIPEFCQMLETTEAMDGIQDAATQMQAIIEQKITESFGSSGYDQALECLRVLRQELLELEEPGMFNDFMKSLKIKILEGKLGGDRAELWFNIRRAKMSLISEDEPGMAKLAAVTIEQKQEFLSVK